MRRVCLLCETWESGGIEAFLSNVIHRMDRSGLELDIVAAKLGESVFTAPLRACGVQFFALSGSLRSVGENHRRFQALLKERGYGAVHLNAYQALSLAYLRIAKEAGVPVRIAHSHNTQLRRSAARLFKLGVHYWARERYADAATRLLACSRPAAEFVFPKSALAEKGFRFIPNGIEVERFRFNPAVRERVRRELGWENQFIIGHIGRLCYQKNQRFLLDMFAEVCKRRPESRLLLVGEGEDRFRLSAHADRLGIAEQVMFYGTTAQIERLYWAMDVFVFPSRFEGLGIAAVEAQAAGLPTICSEKVPQEALATEGVRRLALSAGAGAWAETALQAGGAADRSCGAAQVAAAGFDVQAVAELLRVLWMG